MANESIINEIAEYLYRNPDKQVQEIVAVFCEKLRKSKRTIEGYYSQARSVFEDRCKRESIERERVAMEMAAESTREGCLTRIEAMKILGEIARSKNTKDADRISAVRQASSMEHWEDQETEDFNSIKFIITEQTIQSNDKNREESSAQGGVQLQ